MENYIVACGNWVVKIVIDPTEFPDEETLTFEAATRAMEKIYGYSEYTDGEDIIAMKGEDGKNVLDKKINEVTSTDYKPLFGVITAVYKENTTDKEYHRTSELFANASQPDLFLDAMEAEKKNKPVLDAYKANKKKKKAKK
jgi:hypothetical protein